MRRCSCTAGWPAANWFSTGTEKNPLFAAKPRFRELWGKEKKEEEEEEEEEEGKEEERMISTAITNLN
jgi:hypothetical protein